MTPAELEKILQSDEKLTVKQVKEIILQLESDCLEEVIKNKNRAIENIKLKYTGVVDNCFENVYLKMEKKYYQGEAYAFYICLDLLEKVGEE